jgi:hypothetical protein
MRQLLLVVAFAVLAGCARLNGGGADVLSDQKPAGTTAREFNRGVCVAGNADGVRCNKRECKANEKEGNCTEFGKNCLENGHHLNGTKDAATCSRIM